MRGKQIIRTALLLTTLWLIQGCGFHLRGYDSESAVLPAHISPMLIQGLTEYDSLRVDLSRQLRGSEVSVAKENGEANSALRILSRSSDRRVLSTDSNGDVAEYELHEGVDFDLIDRSGSSLVERQTINVIRTYAYNETEVLGKQNEEDLLRKSMQRDLIGRILHRLQSQL
ncbi:MAG: LPS assembly lipoprotein LptE [Candidatus Sedimenticola sp. (ex Thyasira tokunagai)]